MPYIASSEQYARFAHAPAVGRLGPMSVEELVHVHFLFIISVGLILIKNHEEEQVHEF